MIMQQLIMRNPRIKETMDYIKENGGDPKEAFYKMAESKGVNPDDILNQLRN